MKKTALQKSACQLTYPGKEPEKQIIKNTAKFSLAAVRRFGGAESACENLLIKGDNLPVLKALVEMKAIKHPALSNADGSFGARLVYIDPPFSTMLRFKTKANKKAYDDDKTGADFIEFLRKRLILLREMLTPDGSIYVHLDWKKAHYVKAVMDEVFGEENFLNDIIWSYGGRGAKAVSNQFSRNHDIILWYAKGKTHVFNRIFTQRRHLKGSAGFKQDENGRWYKTSPRGDYTDDSIRRLEKEGRVYRTKNNGLRIKYFLKEDGGHIVEDRLIGDVWDDIPDAMHMPPSEKTGYPTQKPEALLNRIISASSAQGDIVLDSFAGSGTTLAVAQKLGRRWIGIESGTAALTAAKKRLTGLGNGAGFTLYGARRGNAMAK